MYDCVELLPNYLRDNEIYNNNPIANIHFILSTESLQEKMKQVQERLQSSSQEIMQQNIQGLNDQDYLQILVIINPTMQDYEIESDI